MTTDHRFPFVVVGHVDHGKSSFIGRLLFECGAIHETQIRKVEDLCHKQGKVFEYAFLLDAFEEEQRQGITIDTTEFNFAYNEKNYVIIDAPGHREFLKNMVTGAAKAKAAFLIVDSSEGCQAQTLHHAQILSTIGVGHVSVLLNKMDLIRYDEQRYLKLQNDLNDLLLSLGISTQYFIPISAIHGENLLKVSNHLAWYRGPTVLEAIEQFSHSTLDAFPHLRIPVQDIYKFDDRRIIVGRVESGQVGQGDRVTLWPSGKTSKVKSIEYFNGNKSHTVSGENVALTFEDAVFVQRGDVITHPENSPTMTHHFSAKVFMMTEKLNIHQKFLLKVGTQEAIVEVSQIQDILDHVQSVSFASHKALLLDLYENQSAFGRFVLQTEGRIVGGGIVSAVTSDGPSPSPVSQNIRWELGKLTNHQRQTNMGQKGAIVWITGLSGAGKTTLANELELSLFHRGYLACRLDGDNLRFGLCRDLGFSPEDRKENMRRTAEVAYMMAESGLITIVALISPYRHERNQIKQNARNIPFLEVYADCPLEQCEKRDPKGLYQKARRGAIQDLSALGAHYEIPLSPDIHLHTDQWDISSCINQTLSKMITMDIVQKERVLL